MDSKKIFEIRSNLHEFIRNRAHTNASKLRYDFLSDPQTGVGFTTCVSVDGHGSETLPQGPILFVIKSARK